MGEAMSMGPLDAPTFAGVAAIKQNFPAPSALYSRKTSSISTSAVTTQTHAGITSLLITPISYPVLVCFDAPDGTTALNWLQDTTTDADTLNVRYIPVGNMVPIVFSTDVTRWDMLAVGTATAVYQVITV